MHLNTLQCPELIVVNLEKIINSLVLPGSTVDLTFINEVVSDVTERSRTVIIMEVKVYMKSICATMVTSTTVEPLVRLVMKRGHTLKPLQMLSMPILINLKFVESLIIRKISVAMYMHATL